jgi:Reverse transcriptase (RNA-dependent DNA polymerase)
MRTGYWTFMSLLTFKPIVRRSFSVLPIPSHWRDKLNALAIARPPKRTSDLADEDDPQLDDYGPDSADIVPADLPDPWPPPEPLDVPTDDIVDPVEPHALAEDFAEETTTPLVTSTSSERIYVGVGWKVNAHEVSYSSLATDNSFSKVIERVFSVNYTPKKARELFGLEADASITDELQNMLDRNVWHGVLRSSLSKRQRKNIIRCSLFLKEKYSPEGVRLRLKARLVAGGHQQDRSLYDREDISSPTVSINALLCLLHIAAQERRSVMVFDIGTAYLHAALTGTEVYMELDAVTAALLRKLQPSYESFVDENGKILVKLDKALYGCIESAKLWYEHIKAFLIENGYSENPIEPCVFNKITESGVQISIAIYVDDAIATCADEKELDVLTQALKAKFAELNITRGLYHDFLGMKLNFSEPGFVQISMPRYINELLAANPHITTSRKTSSPDDLFFIDPESPLLEAEEKEWFHSTVALLLYVSTRVRKDISVPVGFLHLHSSSSQHQAGFSQARPPSQVHQRH